MVFFDASPRQFIIYAAVSLAATLAIWLLVLHHTNNEVDKVTNSVLSTHGLNTGTAGKLADCVTAAGTDVDKLSACQAKYVH